MGLTDLYSSKRRSDRRSRSSNRDRNDEYDDFDDKRSSRTSRRERRRSSETRFSEKQSYKESKNDSTRKVVGGIILTLGFFTGIFGHKLE